MQSCFTIVSQVEPYTPRPYRIIENLPTCDGIRSRLTYFTFETLKAAREWIFDADHRAANPVENSVQNVQK